MHLLNLLYPSQTTQNKLSSCSFEFWLWSPFLIENKWTPFSPHVQGVIYAVTLHPVWE